MMARKAEPSPRRASATRCSSGGCETSSRFFVAVCMPDLHESFVCFQALLLRDGGQKLLACGWVLTKGAQHAARHHRDPVLANAAGRHTGVGGLDDDRHSTRLEHLVDRVGDLGREPLLDLQPPCIGIDDARELRDSHNTAPRQVADVHGALNGCHVVLTAGLERNIAQDDDLVVAADFFERSLKDLHRILPIALEPLFVGANDASWRVEEPFALWMLARPADQGPHGLFGLAPARAFLGVRLSTPQGFEGPVHQPLQVTSCAVLWGWMDRVRKGSRKPLFGAASMPPFRHSRPQLLLKESSRRGRPGGARYQEAGWPGRSA